MRKDYTDEVLLSTTVLSLGISLGESPHALPSQPWRKTPQRRRGVCGEAVNARDVTTKPSTDDVSDASAAASSRL